MQGKRILGKSSTVALFPILIALNKFKEMGIERFTGNSDDQKYLLDLIPEAMKVKYNDNQIKSFISKSVVELNSILKEHGFDIQLDPNVPLDLGVVTIMDLLAKWQSKATPAQITYEGQDYPAALITSGASIIKLDQYTEEEGELLLIHTTGGIHVFIEKTGTERSGIELFKHISNATKKISYSESPCDAIVPLVTIDEQPDISWLMGLSALNTNLVINQALQQNKLVLNLDGIHAESAVVLGAKRSLSMAKPRPQFVVDQPFNIWLAYADPGLDHFPLFAAYVAPDCWEKK